jgi:hypothetical protein
MERVELFTVEDTFWLGQNGVSMLILHPNFSVPQGWEQRGWSQRTEAVVVVKPDGQQIDATAQINMTHLNIPTSTSIDERWRLTVWLSDRTKDDVPVGSRIFVSPEVRDAILPQNAA